MIFQLYQTFEQFNNTQGLAGVFVYATTVVPAFTPLLLFTFFVILMFGSYIVPKNLTGKGDFAASFAVAGYVTTILALLMSLVDNLINIQTIIAFIVVAVLGTTWLYFSRKGG